MTFEKDAGIDNVDFCDASVHDIAEEAVKKEVKVMPANWSGVEVMIDCHPVEINNVSFHFL